MSQLSKFLRSSAGLSFIALVLALTLGIAIGTIVSDKVSVAGERAKVTQLTLKGEGDPLVLKEDVSLAEGFSRVIKTIGPAVVNIRTEGIVHRSAGNSQAPEGLREFFGDDLMDRFFNRPMPEEQKVTSLGSGVIVDSHGYILTNNHVIARADKISVKLHDGTTLFARILGQDEQSDLAVLKVDSERPLPFAQVGDSSSMHVGDWVLAIGSPFGYDKTVTSGIVSATERVVPTGTFGDYIQTDAAINPGNSGGPLVNIRGEVIGINTFIATRSGGSQGIGFAIPSTVFVNSYNQLVDKGRIERGWLGVSMNTTDMTPEMAEFFGVAGQDSEGIKDGDGVIVTQLIDEAGRPGPGGPAAKAGIQPEDVIVRFGGREVEGLWDLRSAVANTPPGEEVPVVVVRKGDVKTLRVKLDERTIEQQQQSEREGIDLDEREERPRSKEIGVEVRALSARDREALGLEDEEGVLVLDVRAGSLADDAGLRQNQVITHANGKAIQSGQQLKDLVLATPSGKGIVLRVVVIGPDRQKTIGFTSFVKP